jgi:hypothetical protein
MLTLAAEGTVKNVFRIAAYGLAHKYPWKPRWCVYILAKPASSVHLQTFSDKQQFFLAYMNTQKELI